MGLAITAFAERRAVFDTFVTDAPQEIAHVHRQRARQLGVGHQPLFPNVSRCSTIFSAASSGLMAVVSIRISGASGGSSGRSMPMKFFICPLRAFLLCRKSLVVGKGV